MATQPVKKPEAVVFPAAKLAPFRRAMADPEGEGALSAEQAESIRRVEANIARHEGRA